MNVFMVYTWGNQFTNLYDRSSKTSCFDFTEEETLDWINDIFDQKLGKKLIGEQVCMRMRITVFEIDFYSGRVEMYDEQVRLAPPLKPKRFINKNTECDAIAKEIDF